MSAEASETSWHVLQTKPRKQDLVLVHLRELGIRFYGPKIRLFRNGRTRVEPLFPSYLFVALASTSDAVAVRYTPGVRQLVGAGDRPFRVDPEVIAAIRARQDDNGVIRPSSLFTFQQGDKVRVRGGAMDGLEALFESYLPGRQRVQVLLGLLNRPVKVDLPADRILPATV